MERNNARKIFRSAVWLAFNALLIHINCISPIVEPSLDGIVEDGVVAHQVYACFYLVVFNLVILINLIRGKATNTIVFYGMILLFLVAYPLLEIPLNGLFLEDSIVFRVWRWANILMFSEIFCIVSLAIIRAWRLIRKST